MMENLGYVKGDLRYKDGELRIEYQKLILEGCELRMDNQDRKIPSCHTFVVN